MSISANIRKEAGKGKAKLLIGKDDEGFANSFTTDNGEMVEVFTADGFAQAAEAGAKVVLNQSRDSVTGEGKDTFKSDKSGLSASKLRNITALLSQAGSRANVLNEAGA